MIAINFIDNGTAGELRDIYDRTKNPLGMLKVVGRRGANELKTHFRRRDTAGNKLGGRRTHFWRQVADSVNNPQIEGSRVRISIADPRFAQKVFGGTIAPKNAKALTIPVDPLAYGRTVAVFQQTTGIQLFIPRKKGGALSNLLAGFGTDPKHFTVYYILVARVDQEADPKALPDRAKFNAAILDEALQFMEREIIRNAKAGRPNRFRGTLIGSLDQRRFFFLPT